jgi:uncharacterized membrane protein YdjX (TVP38/TMEM64 family)
VRDASGLSVAPPARFRGLLRLFALVLALALLVAAPFLLWGDRVEAVLSVGGALEWMRGTGWGWAAGAGLIVADVVLPVPSTAVIAALGILYGPVIGGLIGGVASMLAGSAGYWLCRAAGPDIGERLAGRAGMIEARRLFERWGFVLVALSRWFPVLPETVAFLAGLISAPFPRFLAALAAGALPLGLVFATAGHLGAEAPLAVVAASALAPVLLWLAIRRLIAAR